MISCDTVRVDWGQFPTEFKRAKLQKEQSNFLKYGNIVAVYWKDKRDVNVSNPRFRNRVDRNGNLVEKIKIICQYNNYMNSVDKCDQDLNYYSMDRKSITWWKRVFF